MAVEAGRFEAPAPEERGPLLRRKLLEEVGEYLESYERLGSYDPLELTDIIEVCWALVQDHVHEATFVDMILDKMATRGDLKAPGVVWIVGE